MTREQAIEEHRKMWRWIAEQYRKGRNELIIDLKVEYITNNFWKDDILNNCFCCEYARNQADIYECVRCDCCPIEWKSHVEQFPCVDRYEVDDFKGLYEYISFLSGDVSNNRNGIIRLAEEIANLPERVCNIGGQNV